MDVSKFKSRRVRSLAVLIEAYAEAKSYADYQNEEGWGSAVHSAAASFQRAEAALAKRLRYLDRTVK